MSAADDTQTIRDALGQDLREFHSNLHGKRCDCAAFDALDRLAAEVERLTRDVEIVGEDVTHYCRLLEKAEAENERLTRQRDHWRDKTRNCIAATRFYLDERDAVVAENERLRAALPPLVQSLRNIEATADTAVRTHARSALNDARVVAALAGGVGDTAAPKDDGQAGNPWNLRLKTWTTASQGVGDTAAPCPDCGREWGKHDPLCSLAGDTAA